MNYVFDESEWNRLKQAYTEQQTLLSPVTRSSFGNLIQTIEANGKQIVTIDQAEQIVTLLIISSSNANANQTKSEEQSQKGTHAEPQIYNDEQKMYEINRLIEQLRLFTARIRENSMFRNQGRVKGRG